MSVATGWEAQWLELLAELLRTPLLEFPVEPLAAQLRTSLDGAGVSWNVQDQQANSSVMVWLPDGPTPEAFVEEYQQFAQDGGLARHPLIRWSAVAGSTPQTLARVPRSISPQSEQDSCREVMSALGAQEQLALPIVARTLSHATFVVARPEKDFSDSDLALARRLQPLLVGLSTQVRVLAAWQGEADGWDRVGAAQELGLTGKEMAVLSLLPTGLTSTGIARRLGISARTVEKHLQRLYRKLGVHDRLSAVLVAQRVGALSLLLQDPGHSALAAPAPGR